MRTKLTILVFTLLIFVLTAFALTSRKPLKTINPLSEKETKTTLIPTIKKIAFKEYIDESGFTFSYPENLKIVQQKADENTYSYFKLNSEKNKGYINIKVTEVIPTSLAKLIKDEKLSSTASLKDIKIAGIQGKEIKTENKTKIIALDSTTLFIIEVQPLEDKIFWEETYQKIISTFAFKLPEKNNSTSIENVSSSTNVNDEEIIDEGEEIVE